MLTYQPPAPVSTETSAIALGAAKPLHGEYMTPREVGELLDRSERTLAGWRRKRTSPPFTRAGSKILYPTDGVREWLKRHEIAVDAKRGRRA